MDDFLVISVIRIIGGSVKGRRLKGPGKQNFRPTTGRVKEFIFSYLGEEIQDAVVLDLFAGTGSLGIEALSRGAYQVFFVEKNYTRIQIIHENLKRCGFINQAKVIHGDVFLIFNKWQGNSFPYILADPPFKKNLREKIVNTVEKAHILASGGRLIIEHEFHDNDQASHGIELIKQRRFGHCVVSVYG
jgi:16S rRNA (guanine(966)-N(2))-methyltransferase RsmD